MDYVTLEPGESAPGAGQAALFAGERRAFPRLKIELFGTCSVAAGPDEACLARDMSVGGLAILCDGRTAVESEAVVSLPQVGLLRGRVVRSFGGGFGMTFVEGRAQRERVSNFLTWLVERETDSGLEDRLHARVVPLRRLVSLAASGESSMARIVDVSRSGVALTSTSNVQVDDAIVVGSRAAVVVRLLEGGLAARFVAPLDPEFDASIVL